MTAAGKRACVIGAGMSGLASIKCLRDAGMLVTCYEKEAHLAGMWNKVHIIKFCSSSEIYGIKVGTR